MASRSVGERMVDAQPASEWLSHGRTYDEQRYSPLDQINRRTIGQLGLAWWVEFDSDRGQESTPLVHDGVLYTTSAWSKVYAFNAKTGDKLWQYDPKVRGEKGFDACCDAVNRGVALWGDKVFVGVLDGRLMALDAKSGKPVWSVQTTDPGKPYTITGAPRAVRGKILIGNAGAEFPVRGYISAYDAETGQLAWRFYMTPNPKGQPDHAISDKALREKAAPSWGDGAWKLGGGGGTPWDAITYDPKSALVFVGTGNAGPWDDELRASSGDNLFTASIVALRPDTGQYVWHYQTTPRDAWDYDAVQQLIVADLVIDGRLRRVLMQANKNGFFYVFDVATGGLISAEKYVPVDWAERVDMSTGRPVEGPMARYAKTGEASTQTPGALGGHNWQPMAYSPTEHLVYIPAQIAHGAYAHAQHFDYVDGAFNLGLGSNRSAPPPMHPALQPPSERPVGELIAWDPVARRALWHVRFAQLRQSGVLTTGGGLVFHSAGPELTAFDAATGSASWHFDTKVSPIAPPMTYAVDGEQYIAVMVGYGGAAALVGDQPRRPGRLLVFRLGGTTTLPLYPRVAAEAPLDLSLAVASKGNSEMGSVAYDRFCGLCHRAGVFLPNLVRSPAILSPGSFDSIVLEGALQSRGMASFRRFLSEAEVENIRAYLLTQATRPGAGVPVPEVLDHPR